MAATYSLVVTATPPPTALFSFYLPPLLTKLGLTGPGPPADDVVLIICRNFLWTWPEGVDFCWFLLPRFFADVFLTGLAIMLTEADVC